MLCYFTPKLFILGGFEFRLIAHVSAGDSRRLFPPTCNYPVMKLVQM